MKTPDSLKAHEADYKPAAWQEYTLQELGAWVHLFVKRSAMRTDPGKRAKDLQDAQAYLDIMQAVLNEAKK